MGERGGQSYQGESRQDNEEQYEEDVNATAVTEQQENMADLSQQTTDLLDDIDDILESNAEEFVKSYVQKGGQ
jgi:ubiquitin-like protein Pup